MNRVRKTIAGLSALAVMVSGGFGVVPESAVDFGIVASAEEDYTEGTYKELTYRNYGDHIEIVGCDKSVEQALIPEKIDGVPVTVIAKDAFKGCTELDRIHLYETVTTIEAGAFSDFNYTDYFHSSDYIYYSGNEEEWAAIEISDDGNEMFKKANVIYDVEPDDIVDGYYSLEIDSRTKYLTGQELDLTDIYVYGYYYTEYLYENSTFRETLLQTSLDEGIKSGDLTLDTSEFDNTKPGTYTIYIHWDAHDVVESFEVTMKENLDVDTYGALTYRNYGDHIEIIDCDETQESVGIPEELYGIPVTAIGDEAFKDCTELTNIFFNFDYLDPQNITSIGRGAFENCDSLKFIVLTCEIDKISADMFKGCKNLNYIYFRGTVKTIEADAFSGCEILRNIYYGGREEFWGDVKIEDGNDAFKNAAVNFGYNPFSCISEGGSITLCSLPDKTEYLIGEELDLTGGNFIGGFHEVYMDGHEEHGDIFLTSLNEGIEKGWISLDASEFDNTKPGTYTIYIRYDDYDDVESFEVTVKDGEASDYTEGTYETLTYRNYGDHIEIVGCDKSAELVLIPEKIDGVPVTVIGKDAFKGCTELCRVHLYETVTTIEAGAFFNFSYSDRIYYSGNEEEWAAIEISDDGNEMFKKADMIYDVEPDDIVDEYYSLKIEILPRTEYLIGQELDLTDVHISGLYTTEYPHENFTISDSLFWTSLDEGIKSGDLTLDTSEFDNTKAGTYTIYIHWDAHDVVESFEVTVKENLDVDTYEGLTYRNYGDHIEIIDCDETQESVVIPEEIYSIPVTAIGDEAFKDCTKLTSIITVGFYDITSIGRGAFENCESLGFIVLPFEIDKISADMFKGCKYLNYIFFESTVKTIEADAFSGCESLEDIYYGGREESWGDVKIEDGNDAVKNAAVNFGYDQFSYIVDTGGITLGSIPDKTEYLIGEELDLTGGDFYGGYYKVYMNGTTEHGDIFLTPLNEGIESGIISLDASEFDNTKPGTYTIYIRYDAYDDVESFEVTVKEGTEGTYETLTYRNYGDHIEIVGCEKSAELILIPEKIDDVPVTVIGKDAFKDCTKLCRVHLYETVTTIESGAFSNFNYTDFIYYSGNEEEWAAIEISDDGNKIFKKADVIYDVEPDDIIEEYYSFNLSPPTKTEYVIGEELDLTGAQFSGSYISFSLKGPVEEGDIFLSDLAEHVEKGVLKLDASEFDNTKPGTYRIYVIYGNAKDSFEVTVKDGENPTEPEVPLGDLDGNDAINATDAAMLLSAAAASGAGGDSGLTEEQIKAADLNADGEFDAKDAAIILQYAAYAGAGGKDTIQDFVKSLL